MLIVDWDVHHGNGTQAIFYGSPEVLYASIHQSPLYPGTGAATDSGSGEGEGYTVNLPVASGSGPESSRPWSRRWSLRSHVSGSPDCSGLGGLRRARDDPLGNCDLDDAAYGDMAATMRDLAAELGARC